MKSDLDGLWWIVTTIASLVWDAVCLLTFLYLLGVLP